MSPKAQAKYLKRYISAMTGRQGLDRAMLQNAIRCLEERKGFISADNPEYRLLDRLIFWADLWHDGAGHYGSSQESYLLKQAQGLVWDALDS